jgi:hypothetical protein
MSLRQPQGREEPGILREALLGPAAPSQRPLHSIPLVSQLCLWAIKQKIVKTGLTKKDIRK